MVEIISRFISLIAEGILSIVTGVFGDFLENIRDYISNIAVNVNIGANTLEFVRACIDVFIPHESIIVCIGITAPFLALNLTMSVIKFIRGLMPF